MTNSAALFRASSLIALDYPFAAALQSALSVCDEAVVVIGQSDDNTERMVYRLAGDYPGRVKTVKTTFTFDRGWQERWWQLAASQTEADWLMYHDADEIIHEQDAPTIRALMAHPDIGLIRFNWCHFYGTDNFMKIKHIAKRNARIGRRSRGWKMENWCSDDNPNWPACQMVYNGMEAHSMYQGVDIADAPGYLYHYGHCRDAGALAISRAKHKAWYADGGGLKDGRLPDVEPVDFELEKNLAEGIITPVNIDHSEYITEWRKAHREQWDELEAECHVLA